jgi:PiT family inorganic phosphate transporter
MDVAVLFFLTSGLFLGWSLGGNDAANVFGTAVGTRMVRFTTAAIICSVFVILGAVISGTGASHTLGKLGAVNALGGSFMAAFAAAMAVYLMTKFGLPVSTTQAIVGAIIGWNLFSETLTDASTLTTILATWVICPVLAAVFAMLMFKLATFTLRRVKPHLLRTDAYTRTGLLLAGAFGAYSLGANNIANVMGVFVPASPFTDFSLGALGSFSSTQQLFLLGAIAIAVGVITYSKRVMLTVGGRLLPMSPIAAWVVVMAHSLVLFMFASEGLESLLAGAGLPTIPLVPVSSSQAVVGAVIGIGLLRGGRGIRWRVLGSIGLGWVATPVLAGIVCFVGLFFLQNVFNQEVYRPVPHALSDRVIERLERDGIPTESLGELSGRRFGSAVDLQNALDGIAGLSEDAAAKVMTYAVVDKMMIDPEDVFRLDREWLTRGQVEALLALSWQRYEHHWRLAETLAAQHPDWRFAENTTANKAYNRDLRDKLNAVYRMFRVDR